MTTDCERERSLAEDIKSLAGASTADLVGIAPGSGFTSEELGDLGRDFGEVKAVIVLAHRIVDPVQLVRYYSSSPDLPGYRESSIATSFADAMLRDACWRVVALLGDAGHRAAIPRNLRYGDSDPRHDISYKKAAVLAGLGVLGRNQLLVHPEWGPWVMLRAVVTDAPLPTDAQIDFSPCTDCGLCIEACPSGALTEAGVDHDQCRTLLSTRPPHGTTVVPLSIHGQINCEECIRACPVGEAPPRMQTGDS